MQLANTSLSFQEMNSALKKTKKKPANKNINNNASNGGSNPRLNTKINQMQQINQTSKSNSFNNNLSFNENASLASSGDISVLTNNSSYYADYMLDENLSINNSLDSHISNLVFAFKPLF